MFSSNEVEQIGNDLHFINLKPEFSGSYSCIALNKAGSDQIEFELSVRQRFSSNFYAQSFIFQNCRFSKIILKFSDFDVFENPRFLTIFEFVIFGNRPFLAILKIDHFDFFEFGDFWQF